MSKATTLSLFPNASATAGISLNASSTLLTISANVQDLPLKATPASNDQVLLYDAASNSNKKTNIAAISAVVVTPITPGTVVQTVSNTVSGSITLATDTFSGLSARITLINPNNKILVLANVHVSVGYAYQNSVGGNIYIKRGSTRIHGMYPDTYGLKVGAQGSATLWANYCNINYLDTPGSAGPHVYGIYGNYSNVSVCDQPSSITLMEVTT